jgi:dihydrofolate reductase
MRRLVYGVAASLDGFIAGPKGEYDWIAADSGIDFGEIYARFDTLLMGRRTFNVAKTRGDLLKGTGMRIVVVSTTVMPADCPEVTVISNKLSEAVAALKTEEGKDIWLMGGGVLFRSLMDAGVVDGIELSVFPVLLGSGTPLLPKGCRVTMRLKASKSLPSGVLMLSYSISHA